MDSFPNWAIAQNGDRRTPELLRPVSASSTFHNGVGSASRDTVESNQLQPWLESVFISQRVQYLSLQGAKEEPLLALEEARMRRELMGEGCHDWHELAGQMMAYRKVLKVLDKLKHSEC